MSLQHYDFFCFRTAALPLNMVEKIYSAHSVHKFIEDALKDPKLRAILWASAPKLMKKREGSFERHENVDFKLAAYLIRASSRSTPSGLLAGISVGKISTSQSDLSLKSNCEYEMAADLDVVFQEKVKELDIQCEGGIKSGNYSLNPAIDFIENTLIVETQLEKYKSIEMRPDIIVFLKKLGVTSKYSLFEIRRRIQKEFSTNKAAAIALERILLQNSILVKVDGYTTISNSPPKAMALLNSKAQKEFRKELDGLQRQNPFECADKIRKLSIGCLEKFSEINRPLHFELYAKHQPVLSERLMHDLSEVFDVMNNLFYAHLLRVGSLSFLRRQSERAMIQGIHGFISFKRMMGQFTRPSAKVPGVDSGENKVLQDYFKKKIKNIKSGDSKFRIFISKKESLNIRDAEIGYMGAQWPNNFAKTISAMVRFIREDGQDLVWVRGFTGGTALSSMARFAYFHSDLRIKLQAVAAKESQLFSPSADIAVRVQGGGQGMNRRPQLFKHEISYNDSCFQKKNKPLPLQDLLVLCQSFGFLVYSKTLKKFIRPVAASAIDFVHSPFASIKFLILIGMQNWLPSMQWMWADLNGYHFPRVQFKNFILSAELWLVPKNELKDILQNNENPYPLLKEKWGLPEWVCMTDHDRDFPIMLNSKVGVAMLLSQMPKEERVVFIEHFLDSGVRLGAHSYASEAVIPFYEEGINNLTASTAGVDMPQGDFRRSQGLSSNWLYFSLFCPEAAHDQVLMKLQREILTHLKKYKILHWHFVRFDYPVDHVRVRFYCGKGAKGRLKALGWMSQVFDKWVAQGWLQDVKQETYHREVETYGGLKGVELFEKLSWVDSRMTLDFLNWSAKKRHVARDNLGGWPSFSHIEFAFIKTHLWFEIMGLEIVDREILLANFTAAPSSPRVLISPEIKDLVRNAHRENFAKWVNFIRGSENFEMQSLVSPYRNELKMIYSAWQRDCKSGKISISQEQLTARVIHMSLNRIHILIDSPQEQEFCKWVRKAYRSARLIANN